MASTVSATGVDRPRLTAMRGALGAGEGWRWQITAPGVDVGSDDMPTSDAPPGPPGEAGPLAHPHDDHHDHGDRPHPLDGRISIGHRHARAPRDDRHQAATRRC